MSEEDLIDMVCDSVSRIYFSSSDANEQYTISYSKAEIPGINLKLQGDAYFWVKDSGDNDFYTKAKFFNINEDGDIATVDTGYILQAPVAIPSDTVKILIFKDGNIYTQAVTSDEWVNVIQITVAKFANQEGLEDLGDGYYAATPESGIASTGNPGGEGFENVIVRLYNSIENDEFTNNIVKAMGSSAILDFTNNNKPINCYFVNQMINGLTEVPIESIGKFLENVTENIGKAGLPESQSAICYMAAAIGLAAYNYWIEEVKQPVLELQQSIGQNNWYNYNYFDSNENSNRASIPYWVAAAIRGADLGSSYDNNIRQNLNPKAMQMVGALMGGLTVGVGMVMFKYVPNAK